MRHARSLASSKRQSDRVRPESFRLGVVSDAGKGAPPEFIPFAGSEIAGAAKHIPGYAPADPLRVGFESFYKIARELPPLFERHWRELALDRERVPLDVDWDRYLALAATDALHVVTVRDGDVLVGYIFNIVGPHLHYRSTIHAELEMFWLDPAYRGAENGWFALRMFRENEKHLRSLGVKKVHVAEKLHFMGGRVGLIFKRLGYKPVETNWGKWIGG